MNIHYLQHVAFEGPGYIKTWLKEQGHELSVTRFYEPEYKLPAIDEIDALIIMGGPMSVYDEHEYPWLHKEKAYIEDCIQAGKKVLGICLGAQLIAVCLGATVYTAKHKEIGWYAVQPTEECQYVPWLYELFKEEPVLFHWHGEKFDIPYNGSINPLSTKANTNQAFYYNKDVLGLQFHPEITHECLEAMLNNCRDELVPSKYIQTAASIKEGAVHIKKGNKLMAAILYHWLEQYIIFSPIK